MNPTASTKISLDGARTLSSASRPLQCLDAIAIVRSCRPRQEVCRQGQIANTWYCVLSGAASCFVIKSDGRRQIVDLLFPGDFFGFAPATEYDYTVEAVLPDTMIAGYSRKRVEAMADSNPLLTREICQISFEKLSRLQQQLQIVGLVRVQQKVGAFILAMADRQPSGDSDRVTLPISRYDIADYLAVSVETVSRALSDLKQRGLIRFGGTRVIRVIDRHALEDGMYDNLPVRPVRQFVGATCDLHRTSASHQSPARSARTASRTASAN